MVYGYKFTAIDHKSILLTRRCPMKKIHFTSITEHNSFFGLPAPEHPLFFITSFVPDNTEDIEKCFPEPLNVSTDFYAISLKKIVSGEIIYGRTKYDFSNGTMLFMAPGQELIIKELAVTSEVKTILIHEDYIRTHEIRDKIKKYNFFSYSVNEALHLSPKEEQLVKSIIDNAESEYMNNPDEFSKDIMLSQIGTLLKYADRFYKRQFINRTDLAGKTLEKFRTLLTGHFESGRFQESGTPKVEDVANELSMSPRYLSDMLKAETGKTAMDHIHLYLIDEAKNLLLDPTISISETAYKLGFEYPQYFSRLFKKKVGISPTAYRDREGTSYLS